MSGVQPEVMIAAGGDKCGPPLLCYWAVREMGYTPTAVGARLNICQPAVSMAVQRGERLAAAQHWLLKDLMIVPFFSGSGIVADCVR